jgi:hypothetical protein
MFLPTFFIWNIKPLLNLYVLCLFYAVISNGKYSTATAPPPKISIYPIFGLLYQILRGNHSCKLSENQTRHDFSQP